MNRPPPPPGLYHISTIMDEVIERVLERAERGAPWGPDEDAALEAFIGLLVARRRRDSLAGVKAQRELRRLGFSVQAIASASAPRASVTDVNERGPRSLGTSRSSGIGP
jgi:hypothetical protein